MKVKVNNANNPNWRVITVKSHIPSSLKKLEEMSRNLWWAWNSEGFDLFRSIDKDLFRKVGQNPVELLNRLSYDRFIELSKDERFMTRLDAVYTAFRQYLDV